MDERQWLTSTDPVAMLRFLLRGWDDYYPPNYTMAAERPTDRKLRLFAEDAGCVACQRVAGHLRTVEYAGYVAGASCRTRQEKVALLRCVFGNPFRPPPLRWDGGKLCRFVGLGQHGFHYPTPYYEPADWLTWHGGTIPRLAQAIYDERRFDDLPILADLLEEAGCTDEAILMHCRGMRMCADCLGTGIVAGTEPASGPLQVRCDCNGGWWPYSALHARGCWVLDLLLGKS